MNVKDSSQDFFALSSQWCADTARILLVAQLNGNKGAVSIADRSSQGDRQGASHFCKYIRRGEAFPQLISGSH